jgi:hypothetical protein
MVKVYGEGAVEQRKCEEMMSVIERRQDSAQPHAAAHTLVIQTVQVEIFEHPTYSPDLASSNSLASQLQEICGGHSLRCDPEMRCAGLAERLGGDLY